ncbi:MAG: Ig-like domain-containing protein, partial [Sporichthyaceae bacterium]
MTRVRDSDSATFPACGTSASSPTSALSCNDLGVTDGDYHYTVTAIFGSWTAVSAASSSVTVINNASLPTVTVTSVSPTPNGSGYNNSSPVIVNLTASAGLGIASITYTVDAGSPVTVTTSTAAVSVSGDGTHTITFSARDTAGNDSATGSDVVRIDTVAPSAPSAPGLTAASDSGSSSTDGITKVTAPTFTGTAEAGSTVTLYDGVTSVGSGIATGGVYTINSSLLASGVHTMTVKATDLAGNMSPASASSSVTIDTTAPAAPSAPFLIAASDSGSSSIDRITNVTTPTFTGTAENGSTVTLYNGATVVGTAVATGGAYSVTSSALTTGVKPMTVKATDVAGNTGVASTSTSITIDITAPAKPGTPDLPAAQDTGRSSTDNNTKITTPTFTGTTTAGYLVTLYDGGVQIASLTAATTTYSFTSPALSNAVHVITTKNTDVAGNLGPVSTSISVTIDTIAPVAPSVPKLLAASDTGKSNTDGITKVTTPTITGTNESKAIVTLYDGASQIGSQTTASTAYSIVSPTLAEGSHTLTATSTDIAGNLGPASAGGVITIDTIAPATSASTPTLTAASDTGVSSTDGITKTAAPTFTGTAGTGDTVTLYDGVTITGVPVTVVGGTYSALAGTLTTGSHTITAVETDVAGNAAPTTAGTTVTIDTTAPTVTINQAAGQADPTTSSPINFTATFSEPVATFSSASVTYGGTALATTSTVSGTGPYNVAASGMTKTGTVIPAIAAAKVTDIAGNSNTAATFTDNTVTYTDTTPPAAPSTPFLIAASDTGTSSTDGVTKVTTPTFTGTAEIGSTVKLFDGVTQVGSMVAAAGTYSIASSALSNGTHTITATATDSSANISPASTGTTVTIDTVLPTVTLNQAAGQPDPTTTTPINFTVTFSEAVTGFTSSDVTYTGTALPTTSTISGGTAVYNVATTGMTKTGTVIPAIAASIATDTAGNLNAVATSTDKTVTYTDNVAPTVVISSFTSGPGQTATASGTAGFGLGDPTTVTVVFCTVNSFPCLAGNTKA